ncbi:hypothetical protein RRG08_027913 [Elysia crispata]|uniref:Cytochrome P450 n=1 Tax=Elysia crispata TaxID=231223 RepID=A0AAE1A7F9_9GAST|nr:hypothetical protein RRG08_027913 [Elysia crispata]
MFATIILGILLLYIMYKYLSPDPETRKMLEKVPGPKPLPLIGNAHQLRMGHDYFLQTLEWAREFPGIWLIWLAYRPELVIHNAQLAEVNTLA